tara:strand:- start:39 stop:239 length:201 start_codon:yes stop_codon:yes gene_type:complete
MPIYEHKCKKCFARFEVLVSFADANKPVPCIECGAASTVRLISKSSFALKGDGWAKDGYGSSGTKE